MKKIKYNQKELIKQARALGIGGKHIGSKPMKLIKAQILSVSKRVHDYRIVAEAIQRAQEKLKAQEAEENKASEENKIIEEVEVENVD